ncbi:unnamed protein product, partial [Didymodactylos carnosus]
MQPFVPLRAVLIGSGVLVNDDGFRILPTLVKYENDLTRWTIQFYKWMWNNIEGFVQKTPTRHTNQHEKIPHKLLHDRNMQSVSAKTLSFESTRYCFIVIASM